MKNLPYEQWIAWRNEGLGSSDAPIIMEASPWQTPLGLWELRTGRAEPEPQNWAMKRGLRLEPLARAEYERLTGIPMPSRRGENKKRPFIRASFDGLNLDAGRVLEIKCPGQKDHLTACRGEIPKKYVWQCVHLLLVADLQYLDYFSYDGKTTALITLKRNRRQENELIVKETAFWNCIVNDTPPPERPPVYVKDKTGKPTIFRMRRSRP